ncbi:MAG TPA: hypothetical protein VFR14_02125 [Candidatus Limnocylindrales bacterium]|nr:hypothetical protein [Candidatus Limnocylindrales bacterium]
MTRLIGVLVNLSLRAAIATMTATVLRAPPDDRRFAGKGIGPRVLIVGLPATLAVPMIWAARGSRRGPYPVGVDTVYLSMYALDLAGNVLDLYDGYRHFDLLPHAHGAGAMTVFAAWALDIPPLSAVGVAQVGHVLLEAQEYYSDVLFGTRNVRGTWDTVGDLLAGVVGSLAYAALLSRSERGGRRAS